MNLFVNTLKSQIVKLRKNMSHSLNNNSYIVSVTDNFVFEDDEMLLSNLNLEKPNIDFGFYLFIQIIIKKQNNLIRFLCFRYSISKGNGRYCGIYCWCIIYILFYE
jgi:hypothetical protein